MQFSPSHSEFYEYHALMMEEEGAVIVGLLVGLNVIDANLCVKGEDLDSQVSPARYRNVQALHESFLYFCWWILLLWSGGLLEIPPETAQGVMIHSRVCGAVAFTSLSAGSDL